MYRILKEHIDWIPLLTAVAIGVAVPMPYGILVALIFGIAVSVVIDSIYAGLVIEGALIADKCWVGERPNLSVFTIHAKGIDRIVNSRENGRGGLPIIDEWLLEDGAIIDGVCSDWIDVGDRFRVADADALNCFHSIVYDRIEHKLYRCKERMGTPSGFSDLNKSAGQTEVIRALCAGVEAIQLQFAFGIWIEDDGSYRKPAEELTAKLRDGSVLTSKLITPPDVRGMSDPYFIVRHPKYRLYDNGTETDVYSDSLDSIVDMGSLVLLKGYVLGRYPYITNTVWHVRRGGRWIAMVGTHLTAKEKGFNSDACYPLHAPKIIADNWVEFMLQDESDAAGSVIRERRSGSFKLAVSWSRKSLTLRENDGRITVHIPK